MKVVIDVSALAEAQLSGVGIYVLNLWKALQKYAPRNKNLVISSAIKFSRHKKRTHIQSLTEKNPYLLNPIFHWSPKTVFHGPDFRVPKNLLSKKIVTIHDLAFFEKGMTSEAFREKKMKQLNDLIYRQNPEAIITVSDFTREIILERYPHLEQKVFVTHLGHEHLLEPSLMDSKKTVASLNPPYFLFVGNLEARKNVIGLLKAFEIFCQESPEKNIELYIIGKEGFGAQEIKEFYQSMVHQSRVKFFGFVTNTELKEVYQSALALVYPSFYEGFGIPLLEAMIHQCPIITSRRTSTKEIAGDAALLVDPFQAEDIAAAMSQLVNDSSVASQLKQRGSLRVKKFTWEQCAQKTLSIYEQVGSLV